MPIIRGICSIENCGRPHKAKGFCGKHYSYYSQSNNPLGKQPAHHGLSHTYINHAHSNMLSRVTNPNNNSFDRYGAKGVKACAFLRQSMQNLHSTLGDRPTPNHTLDRRDFTGNYSCGKCNDCKVNNWPLNIRWATLEQQAWNRKKFKNNTTGYIGVVKAHKKTEGWYASIRSMVNNKSQVFYLGTFTTPEEAAIAYDTAVIFFRGYDGVTNYL